MLTGDLYRNAPIKLDIWYSQAIATCRPTPIVRLTVLFFTVGEMTEFTSYSYSGTKAHIIDTQNLNISLMGGSMFVHTDCNQIC